MGEIHLFPEKRRVHNNRVQANQEERKELADWLRSLASTIERNDAVREPLAITIVLSGVDGDEVLGKGYDHPDVSFRQAALAAYRFSTQTFTRRGGNFYDRKK